MADFRILAPLAVLLGLLSFSTVADASHIKCGSVLTKSVKFDSDLVCPNLGEEDQALTIGASNITVDARGYQIIGPPQGPDGLIMWTNGAYSGVVIKNIGDTPNFLGGFRLQLSNSKIKNNGGGASYNGVYITGNGNVVKNNDFHSGEDRGLHVLGDNNRVVGNTIDARFDPLLVEGSFLTVRQNVASSFFDGYRIKVRDFAGQGIVADNQAIVDRYVPVALVIEGARVNRRNRVVCTNPEPYQCTPESQN